MYYILNSPIRQEKTNQRTVIGESKAGKKIEVIEGATLKRWEGGFLGVMYRMRGLQ